MKFTALRLLIFLIESKTHETVVDIKKESGSINKFCIDGKQYKNNVRFINNIVVPLGKRIILVLDRYDIEYQINCLYDYLRIDGLVTDVRHCGSNFNKTTLITRSNGASVEFVTDDDVTKCGYSLNWYSVPENDSLEVIHSGSANSTGSVYSIDFPRAYPDRLVSCTTLPTYNGLRIVIQLTDLNLPDADCLESQLVFRSNVSSPNRTFCGGSRLEHLEYMDKFFISEGEKLEVCFSAKHLQEGEGFGAVFEYGMCLVQL